MGSVYPFKRCLKGVKNLSPYEKEDCWRGKVLKETLFPVWSWHNNLAMTVVKPLLLPYCDSVRRNRVRQRESTSYFTQDVLSYTLCFLRKAPIVLNTLLWKSIVMFR